MSTLNTPKSFTELPIAGVGPRLAALVYDLLILMGLMVIYGFIAMMVASTVVGLNCQPETMDYNPCVGGPIFQLGALVVITGYYFWSWRAAGQTVGMRAWRLLLASPNGMQLTWRQCILRAIVAPLSIACLGLGYFSAWARSDKATWHDLISESQVRVLPKKTKQ
ncbi:RDD family protein [Microbulbifer sp. OS29]|uniref:RDD family protein n=1 Tax=Microbulbifer okhotskensis TaxID=2926617 RepID=A0A9X2J6Q7_9GAMM|nr:RDD family protein [Microbulbifer okhotskensis]MCO1333736.1 RDD family protein [Microbulbifer okhotskensis]